MIKAHLKYLSYVLRHKYYVFIECCKLGIPFRGLLHDLSKFSRAEWTPYVNYFYGSWRGDNSDRNTKAPSDIQAAFNRAWNHHQKVNSHHPQHWLLVYDNPNTHHELDHYYLEQKDDRTWKVKDRASDQTPAIIVFPPPTLADHVVFYRGYAREINCALSHAPEVLDMPLKDRKEMLADWRGAGKAQGKPDTVAWYKANKENYLLHPATRVWIEEQLGI